MPTLYDLDYSKLGIQLLSPDKRQPTAAAWVKALLSPLQWLHDLFFTSYRLGSPDAAYASGTYAKGNRVRYNKAIYESLIDGNTDAPTTANWLKVQDNFIGLNERLAYNGQKLVLEYAINRWFGTTFRQPNALPDIYLTLTSYTPPNFIIGGSNVTSSTVYLDNSSEFVINGVSFTTRKNFAIHIPSAVYTALGPDNATRDSIIRAFVNQYVPAGILYDITPY